MDNTIKQAVVSVEKLEDWKIKARYFEDGAELDALIDDMNVVIDSAEDVDPYAYTWVDDGKGSLPHRQLRNDSFIDYDDYNGSLPHRQLRKY